MSRCELMTIKGHHKVINNQGEVVEDYVFDNIEDVKNLGGMYKIAYEKINGLKKKGVRTINLYATGLTVAIITIINVVIDLNLELVIHHYDRDSKYYYPQVLTEYLGKGV